MTLRALVFDVDGTLAETEEIHRLSFNRAFAESGLGWSWDRDLYRELLRTTGGRERILAYAGRAVTSSDKRLLFDAPESEASRGWRHSGRRSRQPVLPASGRSSLLRCVPRWALAPGCDTVAAS